jgi:hypothetical protein
VESLTKKELRRWKSDIGKRPKHLARRIFLWSLVLSFSVNLITSNPVDIFLFFGLVSLAGFGFVVSSWIDQAEKLCVGTPSNQRQTLALRYLPHIGTQKV